MVVVANDFHIPFHDERALVLLNLFLRAEKPDWLILNGDFQDFWAFSNFDLTPKPGRALTEEIAVGKAVFHSFRRMLPRSRITWIEGNHEFRLRRFLIRNARELYGIPGLSVPKLFGLKELGIEYIPCNPRAGRFMDTFVRVGNLYVGHWDTVAKHGGYAAKRLVADKGVSILQGHTHRFGAHACTTLDGRVLLGIENFSMCDWNATHASRPNWQLGFSVLYVHRATGAFQWYPLLIDRHRFLWKDRMFTVDGVEKVRKKVA
jgi:UDP-2,3-diacylglucosamine pyrophosphatase LpxH